MPTNPQSVQTFRVKTLLGKFLMPILMFLLISLPKHSDPIARKLPSSSVFKGNFLKTYHYSKVDSYGIKIPMLYSVHGIDVSRYQQKINWRKVKEMKSEGIGVSFVYIKATEGLNSLDPHFDSNWKESKKNGLLRGAYHYFKPKKSGKDQALFFMNSVSHQPGDLPPCIDVEEKGQMKLRPFQKNLREFMKIVEQHTGVKPIIYTSSRFYQDFLKNGFGDYPCWIANYHQPKLLLGKEKWDMWQHSDAAKVDGIKGRVDFNTFNGSLEQLKNLCIKEKMRITTESGASTLRSASR